MIICLIFVLHCLHQFVIGGIFYGLFIPQRFTPGKFDLLPGQAIMHVFMIFGQLCQFSYMVHRVIAFNSER